MQYFCIIVTLLQYCVYGIHTIRSMKVKYSVLLLAKAVITIIKPSRNNETFYFCVFRINLRL